jgi:hypothetical protein
VRAETIEAIVERDALAVLGLEDADARGTVSP